MARNAIVVTVDATTAQFDAAMLKAERATQRYGNQLRIAQARQAEFDAAVAASGASSDQAALAQQRLGAALARTTALEKQAAVEAKRAAEIQAVSAREAASAQQAAMAKQQAALSRFGVTGGNVTLAVAAGFGLAVKSAADFEAKIAEIKTLTGASATQVQALADATKNFADIGVTASEAADAEIELTKAGVSVSDILGGALKGAVDLAAAGQISLADATSIAAQAMTQFQLAGKDLPHVADLLSAGANKALGSVQDLGEALSYAGLPAHQLGVSIEDTVATLSAFAQAGLIGSQGGTALQMMFQRLIKPTGAAAALLDKYNISLYNAQGGFVGMANLAGQLHDKLAGLTLEQRNQALATIFSARAIRGANVLYQEGAKGIEDWTHKVDDAGNASRTASGKLDSLAGDFDKLKASVANAAVDLGGKMTPALRGVTKALTEALSFYEKNVPKFTFFDLISGDEDPVAKVLAFRRQALAVQKATDFGQAHGGLAAAQNAARQLGGVVTDFGEKFPAAASGVRVLGTSLDELAGDADKAWKALLQVENATLTGRADFRSYQQAVDDAQAALKENGKTLNAQTQAGRDNAAALDQIASSASEYAQTISDPVLQLKFLQQSRSQLLQTAQSFGMSKQAAQDYVNQVLGIPKEALTEAQFEKNQAYNDIEIYKKAINSVPGFKNTVVTAQTQQAEAALARLVGLLGVIHSKSVFINVNTQYTHSGVQAPFADGGIVERHDAQIPPKGLTRVWNEPEAGGEAYIPFAPSKRPRSRAIATEAVSRLGGEVRWHANGALYGGGSAVMVNFDASQIRQALDGATLQFDPSMASAKIRTLAHQVVRSNTNLQANVEMAQATR